MSKIEWTNVTWNPVIGCDKVSEGCKNCYAINMANRHQAMGTRGYNGVIRKSAGGKINWSGKINLVEEALEKPLKRKKPAMYFVNSMSDLFHEDVPFHFIDQIFAVMAQAEQHTFQILTKRPHRAIEYFETFNVDNKDKYVGGLMVRRGNFMGGKPYNLAVHANKWPLPNVWLGVSVENQEIADERIPLLLQIPAAVRWLSCEPLLGEIDLGISDLTPKGKQSYGEHCINWVVCGGESGHGARPMHPYWARKLRDDCFAAGVPFFFKQWGEWAPRGDVKRGWIAEKKDIYMWPDGEFKVQTGTTFPANPNGVAIMKKVGKKRAGRELDGKEWNEYPQPKTPFLKF